MGRVVGWRLAAVVAASGCALSLSACTTYRDSRSPDTSGTNELETDSSFRQSCSSLFAKVLARERAGDRSGAIDAELDTLGQRCPGKYEVFVDYVSIQGTADLGMSSCSEYARYDLRPAAIRLARQDGFCSGSLSGVDPEHVSRWSCDYSPTYNRDWHDDVVCSNGTERHRPYLRGNDSFVTQDEIMQSAREYERLLNGG